MGPSEVIRLVFECGFGLPVDIHIVVNQVTGGANLTVVGPFLRVGIQRHTAILFVDYCRLVGKSMGCNGLQVGVCQIHLMNAWAESSVQKSNVFTAAG